MGACDREDRAIIEQAIATIERSETADQAKDAVSLLPSPLAAVSSIVIDRLFNNGAQRNLARALQVFFNAIQDIDINKCDMEYIQSDDFSQHVLRLMEISIRETRREKIRMIQNFIRNTEKTRMEDIVTIDMMLPLLDNMNPELIAFMCEIDEIERNNRSKGNHSGNPRSYSRIQFFQWYDSKMNGRPLSDRVVSSNKLLEHYTKQVSIILNVFLSYGFLEVTQSDGKQHVVDELRYSFTELAIRFAEYIGSPSVSQ